VVRGLTVIGMFSAFFLGALYLEHVLGYSPTRTGLAFLPQTLGVGVLSLGVTARIVQRFGPKRTVLPGLVAIIAGLALLASSGERAAYFPSLFFAFVLMGIGGGTAFMPLLALAMSEVPRRDAGLASGIVNVSMQISAAIGLAALGAISTGHTAELLAQGHPLRSSLVDGYHLAFTIAAACVGAGLLAALVLLRSPERVEHPEQAAAA
jgi:MFS family permease